MNTSTPAYFLPGTMCDQRLWQPVWEKLPNSTKHFISLSQGNSFTELTTHVHQQMSTSPSHLVGFSMGGYVALQYALTYPERIKSLVLVASSAKGLQEEELKMREYSLQYLKEMAYNGISQTRIKQMLHPSQLHRTDVVNTIKEMDKTLGKEVLIAQLEATSKRISLLDQLSTLTFPVLMIGSTADQIVPITDLLEMYPLLEEGKLTQMEGCGHMIPLEKPEELAAALNDWFIFYT